jgi:prepilin peptidase CpaA
MLDWLASLDPRVVAPRASAWWFLPFAVPLSVYVVWSDLRAMRIPNRTVIVLFCCFVVAGPFALPLADYGWRLVFAVAVLAVGFFLNALGGVGAGDVKFAAAAAPLVAPADGRLVLVLFASVLLAAFATHRAFRAVPAVRRRTPGWESWSRHDFPMGLALGGTLIFYLILVARYGV